VKQVEIVLGGGAARGLTHIGVLEILEERGVEVAAVAGCSMGAIVAACYCRRGKVNDCYRIVDGFRQKSLFNLIRSPLSKGGIVSSRKYALFLKEIIGESDFEKLSIPFYCNAVDLLSGKEVVLKRGKLIEALQASSAVPGIFPAVCSGKQILVDGGVLNPLPVNLLSIKSKRIKIAVNVFNFTVSKRKKTSRRIDYSLLNKVEMLLLKPPLAEKERELPGALETLLRSFLIMQQALVEKSIALYPPDLLINIPVDQFGFFDFSPSAELIRLGREAMLELLDYLLFLLKSDESL